MFKKYIKQSLFVLAAMIFLAACTKNGTDYSVIKTTPPELHVVVVSDDNNTAKVAGATVTLYKSQTDLENSSNAIATKESGSDGEAVFTSAELKEKGIFYAKVEKDGLTASKASQYMLLTDGHTYLFIKLG